MFKILKQKVFKNIVLKVILCYVTLNSFEYFINLNNNTLKLNFQNI